MGTREVGEVVLAARRPPVQERAGGPRRVREVAAKVAGPKAADVVGARQVAEVGRVVGHRPVLSAGRAVEVGLEGPPLGDAKAVRPVVHGPRRARMGESPHKLKGHRPAPLGWM